MRNPITSLIVTAVALGMSVVAPAAPGETLSADDVRQLIEQNRRLQEQVTAQQRQLDELRARLDEVATAGRRQEQVLDDLRDRVTDRAPAGRSDAVGDIRLSGEAGLAFFDGGPRGAWPNGEFRADDVKVYLETPVWRDTYLFAELDLVTREVNDEYFHMGEVYVDFENVSGRLGGPDRLLNVRIGRLDIPFGEEYLNRGVLDNPLITHSVADLWGVDEGVELYGAAGRLSYVFAVQNGGHKTLRDFDSDKSVTLRVGYDPNAWLHLSASALRTGDLTVAGDFLSEIWIGGGFFRSIGTAATTQGFAATLYQGDARVTWDGGHLSATVGTARYDDNDTAADNRRDLDHYAVELVQRINGGLYGAIRYSEISVQKGGYPLQGLGSPGTFFYSGLPLAEGLERFSLGLGYRFSDPLVFKIEYAWEDGRMLNGQPRNQEDLFATEIGVRF